MLGPSRILEKGPEYLRKQMEREREATGRVSAAERLAATKPNYVKSPQVSSPSNRDPLTCSGEVRTAQVSSPSTREQLTSRPKDCDRDRERSDQKPGTDTKTEREEATDGTMVKRNSSKKRPDSILLYRQKCELQRGSANMGKRTLVNPLRPRNSTRSPASTGKSGETKMQLVQISVFDEDGAETVPDESEEGLGPERARKAVARSHSDISSRYSKNFGDFDAFFTYCGLEDDVVQAMGRENFSSRSDEHEMSYARIRSVSVATSDGEVSHTSGDMDGLHEEEMRETRQQGSSVIERNARIIKWLYSCRNASQSGKTLRDLH